MKLDRIEDEFLVNLFLQVMPKKVEYVKKEINKIFGYEKERIDLKESKILNIYGKHDILCFIKTKKLKETIDFAYSIVQSVDEIR